MADECIPTLHISVPSSIKRGEYLVKEVFYNKLHEMKGREKTMLCGNSIVWLTTLKKRNNLGHIYNEDEIDEMLLLIRDSFIPAFVVLENTLRKKLGEAEGEWE